MIRLKDCILVMLECISFDGLMQRHQHLARELSQYLPVVYVEETPSRIKHILSGRPLDRALSAHKLGLREIEKNLFYFKTPPYVPRQMGFRRSIDISSKRIMKSLKPHLPDDRPVILWLFSYYGLGSIGLYDEILSVFDCFDAFGEFPGEEKNRDDIHAVLREIAAGVDLVIATNDELRDRLAEHSSNTAIVPNGCNPDHFINGGREPAGEDRIIDIESLPRPIIGYMGDIAPWIEMELFLAAAKRHPEWSIVLLGTWKRGKSVPRDFSNIYMPGRVPYEELPYYAGMFDVGTIPFVLNDLTRVVNPLKLYEYFAMGIPVVATPLPEITRHEDIAYIARSPDEFVALLEIALKENVDAPVRNKRMEIARENSWRARGESIKELLENLLKNRS